MDKVYASARALAVAVAFAAAFITVPYATALLLLFGAIAGIANSEGETTHIMLAALVLGMGSKSLEAIPGVGGYLALIFGGVGVAAFGAAVMGILVRLSGRVIADWAPGMVAPAAQPAAA